MSFAAGIAAGTGAGLACGISAGRSQAIKQITDHLGELESSGRIRITDEAGRALTVDALLRDAVPDVATAARPKLAIVAVILGVLALAGVAAFLVVSG